MLMVNGYRKSHFWEDIHRKCFVVGTHFGYQLCLSSMIIVFTHDILCPSWCLCFCVLLQFLPRWWQSSMGAGRDKQIEKQTNDKTQYSAQTMMLWHIYDCNTLLLSLFSSTLWWFITRGNRIKLATWCRKI